MIRKGRMSIVLRLVRLKVRFVLWVCVWVLWTVLLTFVVASFVVRGMSCLTLLLATVLLRRRVRTWWTVVGLGGGICMTVLKWLGWAMVGLTVFVLPAVLTSSMFLRLWALLTLVKKVPTIRWWQPLVRVLWS